MEPSGNPSQWLRPRVFLLGAACIGALLLFPLLATIPGLHGDEAWGGLRANEILHGARPMVGMNGYTGPLHQYLVAFLFQLFGCKVAVLRSLTGITTLFSIFLYYGVIKRCFNQAMAALSALVLVSLPFFMAYGRIAHEVFALNPILALAAAWLLLESGRERFRKQWALPWLAGICLGLGTWNHLIFASVPLALFATAIFRDRTSLFRNAAFYAVGYGFLVALSPEFSGNLWPQTTVGRSSLPASTCRGFWGPFCSGYGSGRPCSRRLRTGTSFSEDSPATLCFRVRTSFGPSCWQASA